MVGDFRFFSIQRKFAPSPLTVKSLTEPYKIRVSAEWWQLFQGGQLGRDLPVLKNEHLEHKGKS